MFVERSAGRIRLVRRLFVLCGLLPLIALVAAAVWRQGATRRGGLESRITAALSLPVSIGSVTDPRPGVMLLRDVVIGDAGGGMVSVSRLRVEESAAEIRVVVDAVECPPDAARVFARLARTWLEGEYRFRRDWVVDCERVGWGEAAGAVPLEQVRVECVATAGVRGVRLRTTGAGVGDDVRLRRLRDDDGAIRHECEARIESPVAAVAVARGLGLGAAPAGRDATFRGEAHLTCTSGVWSGRCAGVVTGLDLGQLTAGLPDGVDGSATLQVEQAEVRDGRLVEARFECHSPAGTISRRLLAGCIDSAPSPPVTTSPTATWPGRAGSVSRASTCWAWGHRRRWWRATPGHSSGHRSAPCLPTGWRGSCHRPDCRSCPLRREPVCFSPGCRSPLRGRRRRCGSSADGAAPAGTCSAANHPARPVPPLPGRSCRGELTGI
jgi:hypothetical protein